jgi:hypothetical protein
MTIVKRKHIIRVWYPKQLNLGDKLSKISSLVLQKLINKQTKIKRKMIKNQVRMYNSKILDVRLILQVIRT